MKLRIRGNSIRLRLTQSEVQAFLNRGWVSDQIVFDPRQENQLRYELKIADCDRLSVEFVDQKISVLVPEQQGLIWANTEEVSMAYESEDETATLPKILVEKDFQCLKVRPGGEDQDTFPNPHAS
ncbi:MAG: hypothetical protein AAGD05_06110 [Bacteroidota bacterium]